MIKRRKWTTEEERVLIDQITRNANNLREAFRKTARLIDRTEAACMYHWYGVMSKKSTASSCFMTIRSDNKDIKSNVFITWWKNLIKALKKQ